MSKMIYPPSATLAQSPIMVKTFLAGSIEMGKAEPWQDELGTELSELSCIGNVFNPRRADWDSSWKQSIKDPQFNQQVNWELDHIDESSVVYFYFDPATQSPITLMELGYVCGRQESFVPDMFVGHLKPTIVVTCPDGFWRKGNIEIICSRAGVQIYNDKETGKKALITAIWKKHRALANAFGHTPYKTPWDSQSETNSAEELTDLFKKESRGSKRPKFHLIEEKREEKRKAELTKTK